MSQVRSLARSRRRRTLLLGGTVATLAAVAALVYTPSQQPVGVELTTAAAAGAPVPGTYAPFGADQSPHAAFPTAARLADGTVRMVWRQGTAHASYDGRLYTSVGNPSAGEWSPPTLLEVDGGPDVRDPHLSVIDGDVWLTYFVRDTNGTPTGARAAKSTDGGATFGPSVRLDANLPYAAVSSPIVKAGGKLWGAFYARKPGETIDTVWAAWSTDNGQTWTSNRIANGIGSNYTYTEPWVVTNGTNVVYLFRDGSWNAIGMRSTPDGGATWTPVYSKVIPNATANSASVWASNGRIYTVYRHTTTRAAMLASSADGGKTFTVERELMRMPAGSSTSSVGMSYAHPIELGAGYIWCPLGMERTPTDSRLYAGYL